MFRDWPRVRFGLMLAALWMLLLATDARAQPAADRGRLDLDVDRHPTSVLAVDGGQGAPTPTRRDSVVNGVLIGAGVGGLVGLIPDYYDDCEECHDSLYASIGVGAAVGLIVDLLRGKPPATTSAPQAALVIGAGPRAASIRVGGVVRWR